MLDDVCLFRLLDSKSDIGDLVFDVCYFELLEYKCGIATFSALFL